MICKDLFKNSNVVFVPAEDNLQQQESRINLYANYNRIDIKITLGVWVDPKTAQALRVLRLENLGETKKPLFPSRAKMKALKPKNALIIERYKQGVSRFEIAKEFNLSKQRISQIIKQGNGA